MANAFADNRNNNNTIIPDAAKSWNSCFGFVAHWNIWIGIAVYLEKILDGSFVTIAAAPTTNSGADSPNALDNASITPVNIPGAA